MKITAIVVGIDHADMTHDFCRSLIEHNPGLRVILIDNGSTPPYEPGGGYQVVRIDETVGYNNALNAGLDVAGDADWYICFNNDCKCYKCFTVLFDTLDPLKLYGSGENTDDWRKKQGLVPLQSSAWLVISREIYLNVGGFDPELDAAFEDFDYELAALDKGFGLATLNLPVVHLDKHTRFETLEYNERWKKSAAHYRDKWNVDVQDWFK